MNECLVARLQFLVGVENFALLIGCLLKEWVQDFLFVVKDGLLSSDTPF